ncbi:MAG: M20/M25/M40 family metallo-hydrolase [Acidaminococcaceae bacterium]|nr:M20/M25/M40 family metallo-hydrolase [Acidaminococcaceae bacterium]
MEAKQIQIVEQYIDLHKAEMISRLQEFVELPSCSREPEVMPAATAWVVDFLKKEGYAVKTREVGHGNAPVVIADLQGQDEGAPVIFAGHYDTALSRAISAQNPVRIEDGKMYGTGTLDMKGGIVIALFAIRAALQAGLKRPVRLILAGDEEINHLGSRAPEVFKEEAKGGLFAFNMETGLLSNKICVFRKGGTRCRITVTGVEAHAGNDFTKGRSAIVEMAYKIIDIHNLTDLVAGTTMNIGTINGGTIFNAVPAKCEIIVDMRFEKNEELEKAKKNLEAVCQKTYIEGTTTEMEYIDVMHVLETTEGGLRLWDFLRDTAAEMNLAEVGQIRLGGSSDAAYITMAGVPCLCSCGTMGEWNHTVREYIRIDSLPERAELYAGALLNADAFTAAE